MLQRVKCRKDYTMCTTAKTYEIGQNRMKRVSVKCGNVECGMRKVNAHAEWCVECGMRKACNQGVLLAIFGDVIPQYSNFNSQMQ